jgi:hypothetical protein
VQTAGVNPNGFETRVNQHRRARNLAIAPQAVTGQRIIIQNGKAIIT